MNENVAPIVIESVMEPESKRAKIEQVDVEKVQKLTISFVKLDENAKAPFYGSEFAAGADLHASEACIIPTYAKKLVSTGLKLALPHGTYGRVAPRSGLAVKNQIDVGAGVIDEDYRGEVKVCLFNFGKHDFEVKQGDRIAQIVCQEISSSFTKEFPKVAEHVLEVRLDGENAKLPTKEDSGVVFYSSQDGSVAPGDMIALSTGVHVAIPTNYYGRLFILNDLAIKHSLKVFAGVIDADYRGEIKVLIFNHGKEAFEIKTGDAVGMMTCEKVASCNYENVEELTETERGEGGFGSTGTNEIDDKSISEESVKVFTVKKLAEDVQEPVYGSVLAAGADIFSADEVTIAANNTALISTGLKLSVQPGHYIRVAPRSGLAVKNFIDVGASVYFGNEEELKVLLFNLGQDEFVVKKGERIAQLVAERIAEIEIRQVENLSETKRGTGGFGSTGISA